MIFHFSKSLSFRLKALTGLWLVLALGAIAFTLLLSWYMQGKSAAINDTGSLRMQTYRLELLIHHRVPTHDVMAKLEQFDQTLHALEHGDPKRPLLLPENDHVKQNIMLLKQNWHEHVRPHFQAALQHQMPIDQDKINHFVTSIDVLTHAIEQTQNSDVHLLRLFQMSLLVLVLIGAGVMSYLFNIWVLEPIRKLQTGVQSIHDGQFGVQVPIDNVTEFAELDYGFNKMSTHLRDLYRNLESQVTEKTHHLEQQTRNLQTLYDFSNWLNQAQTPAEACEGFLQKIMPLVPAQASSIRLIDLKRNKLDLIAQQGLPELLQTATACQRINDCLCGTAVKENRWQPIHFHHHQDFAEFAEHERQITETTCRDLGFHFLRVFHIRYQEQDLGVLTLYFKEENHLNDVSDLIDSLCQQLASAVNNLRLSEESRQLAVMQERNLMAQGLHDSIAQTLNFLNLQTQMLERSLHNKNDAEIAETLQYIKEGVKECYDDVRELLLNFRTKITRKEFAEAIDNLAQRFRQQTHCQVWVDWEGDGMPLSSSQQLQFIFILQESLSNIRKHADADEVRIQFENHHDFVMTIQDNGQGFDMNMLDTLSDSHIGLNIMQERALRIHAQFDLQSRPQHGTTIRLTLPKSERVLE